MQRPNLFIVGAPKAGTSSLYKYLRGHPDVFMPRLKEPHHFGNDHRHIHRPPRTTERYLRHFEGARGETRVGEASTTYLHSRTAPDEILEFSPTARIIIMLRNPVDMMYALHGNNVNAGFEPIRDFEAALDAEPLRAAGERWPERPGIVENLLYREMARYSEQVARYLEKFGAERVHIITFDDFRCDVAGVYRDVLQFLEVEADHRPEFQIHNRSRAVASRRVQNFLLRPPLAVQAISRVLLGPAARARLVGKLAHLNTVERPRPPLSPQLRAALTAEFRPDVERLAAVIGRDLSGWLDAGAGASAARIFPSAAQ